MASTISGRYEGRKRIELTHEGSGAMFVTDAPIDNNGEGKSFSPTDLLAASYASCVLTIIAIRADKEGWGDLSKASFTVEKHMTSGPRRVDKLVMHFELPADLTEEQRSVLEKAGRECPIEYSVHPDIEREIRFSYQ